MGTSPGALIPKKLSSTLGSKPKADSVRPLVATMAIEKAQAMTRSVRNTTYTIGVAGNEPKRRLVAQGREGPPGLAPGALAFDEHLVVARQQGFDEIGV